MLRSSRAAVPFWASARPGHRPATDGASRPAPRRRRRRASCPASGLTATCSSPNQWSLRPAGKHLPLGDFPVNIALHPGGQWVAVLHAGYGEHEIVVVELHKDRPRIVSRVSLDSDVLRDLLCARRQDALRQRRRVRGRPRLRLRQGPAVATTARSPSPRKPTSSSSPAWPWTRPDAPSSRPAPGATPSPSCRSTTRATAAPSPSTRAAIPTPACPTPRSGRLFVSLWGKAGVAVIDPADGQGRRRPGRPNRIRPRWSCRPTARRCSSPAPTRRKVSVLDARRRQGPGDAPLRPLPRRPVGQHAQQPAP